MKAKLPFLIAILVAVVALCAPSSSWAKEKKTAEPAASASPEASAPMKKPRAIPYHGKIAAVDAEAKTFTVGKRTFKLMEETKMTKAGADATMSDITVGEAVSGSYWKKEDGSLEAKTVKLGAKSADEKSMSEAQKKEKPQAEASAAPKP